MIRKTFNLTVIILLILISSIDAQSLAKQKHSLNTALDVLKYDVNLANAGIGFYAVDINSGEVLATYNQDLALTPASTLKLFSTATALEYLGPDFQFETKLYYTGKLDKNTQILEGDIIIEGWGDPTLGSKYFNNYPNSDFLDKWVTAIKNLGIKYIDGRIIGDAKSYGIAIAPRTRAWEDIGNYYGAGPCGLNIYDNLYNLYFNTGKTEGSKTQISKIEPEIPGLEIVNMVTSEAIYTDQAYIFGSPYTYYRYIQGELPLNKKDFKVKGAIPDPPFFTAYELKSKLKVYGINSGIATTDRLLKDSKDIDSTTRNLVNVIKSPTLIEIINKTNFTSINFFAEQVFAHSQLTSCNFDLSKIDKNFIENFWRKRGLNTSGMRVYDGSGLSRYNTLTAKQLVSLLVYMKKKSKYAEYFYNSLPVVGKEGTVKSICKGSSAENNMRAKSGSFTAVRAYSGYVTTKSGREVAFSIIVNNFNRSSVYTRKKMEKVMIAIADFNL